MQPHMGASGRDGGADRLSEVQESLLEPSEAGGDFPARTCLDVEQAEAVEMKLETAETSMKVRRSRGECPPPMVTTDLGRFLVGDCLRVLRDTPDNSIDLVITSPPYDGQPKYGNGEKYERDWYEGFFLQVSAEILRVLKPHGSFVLNYRSRRYGGERGTLQYELIFWLRRQGFFFCEDFVWGKPSPPPGRFKRYLKDAVEYCFQFAKTEDWQFFPEHCLSPARWDAKDRERRKKLAHNYERVNEPSGQGRRRVQAGPDLVRPSTLLHFEAEFGPNPSEHPARFPMPLPTFFINLLSKPGQIVLDPFGGTGTTGLAAEILGRKWLSVELDPKYVAAFPERLTRRR